MKGGFVFVLIFLISISFVSSIEIKSVSIKESDLNMGREIGVIRQVYGFYGLVASVNDEGIQFPHNDRIRSNRIFSLDDGDISAEFKSTPFGVELLNTGIDFSFATGKEKDESDLYYFGARYYNPKLGRFSSVDSAKENHAYTYVSNNLFYYLLQSYLRLKLFRHLLQVYAVESF